MNHFFEMGLRMDRSLDAGATKSAKTPCCGGSPVGKFRSLPAVNNRMWCVHPKDSDLVVDSEKFRVI
jgi:hypothetical protein